MSMEGAGPHYTNDTECCCIMVSDLITVSHLASPSTLVCFHVTLVLRLRLASTLLLSWHQMLGFIELAAVSPTDMT